MCCWRELGVKDKGLWMAFVLDLGGTAARMERR